MRQIETQGDDGALASALLDAASNPATLTALARNGAEALAMARAWPSPRADKGRFSHFAKIIAYASGRPWAFALAVLSVLVWLLTGPMFHYSDTWQLVINTSTTIITFLMVFLIQNTQNRDNAAIQAKLDELIRVTNAKNGFIGIEKLTDKELEGILDDFEGDVETPLGEKSRIIDERAKLAGDMSLICHKFLHDTARAVATAQLALHIDPSNGDALRVLGDDDRAINSLLGKFRDTAVAAERLRALNEQLLAVPHIHEIGRASCRERVSSPV